MVGFALWKRDLKSGAEPPINNRIPPKEGAGSVPDDGISSLLSPIRRCIWFDHSINAGDNIAWCRLLPPGVTSNQSTQKQAIGAILTRQAPRAVLVLRVFLTAGSSCRRR